jgi:hypothetical protein
MTISFLPLIKAAPAVALGAALALSSCGSLYQNYEEQLVRSQIHGGDAAPTWVQGQIQSDPYVLSFVGRGMAYNVLDERKAFDEAVMHAREQLAQYVRTRVVSKACDEDWAHGARFLPVHDAGPGSGELVDASLEFRASQMADAFVGELLPVAQYWEQWDVEESPNRHISGGWIENKSRFDMRRYKCWVLTQVDKDRVETMVQSALTALEAEASLEAAAEAVAVHQAELELAREEAAALVAHASDQRDEIMRLRERIHYGRPFRLTSIDNCAKPETCKPVAHPDWRNAAIEVNAEMTVTVKEESCDPCDEGGH